jgi:hypothetical protein
MQKKTKNGRAVINRATKLPVYNKPVDMRLINIKKELNENATIEEKHDNVWNAILASVKQVTTKGVI